VHLRAGQIYESQARPEEALGHYRKAQQISPQDLVVPFVVGRTLFQQGKDAEAIAEFERARQGPQKDAATRLLVLSLSRLGRHGEVNTIIRELDPARWSADQAREFGLGLAGVGRVDLSIAAWRRAAEASGDGRDYDRLGLAWVLVKRPVEALAAFDEAVNRAPASAPIRLNRAVTLAALGRRDEARRDAEEALRLDPSYDRSSCQKSKSNENKNRRCGAYAIG
jgi:tetratricopeptide (TPR) repeat protein